MRNDTNLSENLQSANKALTCPHIHSLSKHLLLEVTVEYKINKIYTM